MHGHSDWIRTLAFDPSGRVLGSAGEDGRIFIWDVASGTRVTQIEGAMSRVFAVAFCDKGRCVVAGGAGNTIHLFSPKDGSRIGELAGHEGWVSAIVSPDASGINFASCSEDGTVKLWDLARRECTGTLVVGCKVWCGSFCDRGESFLSGSEDGTLRRWALKSRHCESEARAHQGAVWSLAVNSDEDTVATAGNDGNIRLWRLPDNAPYSPVSTLRPARPYEGMNITNATGLTSAQTEALLALGAIRIPSIQ
jgi:WD40 repeat protein